MGRVVSRNGSALTGSASGVPNSDSQEGLRWRNHAIVFLLFLILGVVYLLPGSLAPSSALLGNPGDNFQHAWFLWHFARAVAHGQDPFYTRLLFYPSRVTLAWSTSDPIGGLMVLPLSLTVGPIVAYNLSLILQLALAAFCARLLCLRITRNEPAAFIGGMVFGFSSFLLAHALGHLGLVTAFAIPLFVLALDRIFRTQNPSWKLGIPLGAALLLAAFAHYNYVIVCLLFAFFWLAIDLLRDFATARFRPIARMWKPLTAGAATFLVGFSPLLWMMVGNRAEIPVSRDGSHFETFSADVLGFLIPSWNHILLGRFVRNMAPRIFVAGFEGTVYGGVAALALAAIGFWKGRAADRTWARRALTLSFIFYLLSLGPRLRFFGHPLNIPGPAALFYLLPFAKFVSAPARFHVGFALCLAVLSSLGVKFFLEKIGRRSHQYLAVAAIAAMVMCDSLTIPFPRSSITNPGEAYSATSAPEPFDPPSGPSSQAQSCNLPPDLRHGTVLTFPLVNAPYCLKSMWMQVSDGGEFALLDGYLSYTPPEVWKHFWDVPILRSLTAIQGMVNAPIDVASDRKTARRAIRSLNLSAIVVYDSPQGPAAMNYLESVFGAKPQRAGTCTVFSVQQQ
jgi:hypothetical protein